MTLALLAPDASAAATPDVAFTSARHDGQQVSAGALLGVRIQPGARMDAAVSGFSPLLHVHTTNRTADTVAQGSPAPANGGIDRDYQQAALKAEAPDESLDLLIVPVPGGERPTVTVSSTARADKPPAASLLREVAYVDSDRTLLSSNVGGAVWSTAQATRVRIEGTFAVSVWSLNFTVGQERFETGSIRSNIQREPITGRELAAHTVEQVAQLTFNDGWLEVAADLPVTTFTDDSTIEGSGLATLEGVGGLVGDGSAHPLVVEGSYALRQAWTGGQLYARFERFDGQGRMDGQVVHVPIGTGDSRPGMAVSAPSAGGLDSRLVLAVGFAAVMLVAVVAHGPMRSLRFRALQRRFDQRDYLEVLTRIDPFTRRSKFSRQANLLKAVSLLSLQQFREAGLFLRTLRPIDGPDPATQAFLRACAFAGQAQDAAAIQHLEECFKLDPTYVDEARTVPALRSILPYFELGQGGTT